MLTFVGESFFELMRRGGWVMWPLLGLSLLSATLLFERCWFFVLMNHPDRLRRVDRLGWLLRQGGIEQARALAGEDGSVYGDVVRRLLSEPINDASIAQAVEAQRRRLERFMPTLSTVITLAPMLGILGTVLGIIASFELLSDQIWTTDPKAVSQGIAEALITTAAGLIVAAGTLLPYNILRAQIDRTLSRIEVLAWSAAHAQRGAQNLLPTGAKD
ncbi:MAG TPA: MotA/TolQ/ExbB proton channel family protein [Phycisphaeraceae bacterium]